MRFFAPVGLALASLLAGRLRVFEIGGISIGDGTRSAPACRGMPSPSQYQSGPVGFAVVVEAFSRRFRTCWQIRNAKGGRLTLPGGAA